MPYRRMEPEEMNISNSIMLLSLLDSYEGMIRIAGRQTVYATTYPFADADVQRLAWLFTYGKLDEWTDKIFPGYALGSSRSYPPPDLDQPILRMSGALRMLP